MKRYLSIILAINIMFSYLLSFRVIASEEDIAVDLSSAELSEVGSDSIYYNPKYAEYLETINNSDNPEEAKKITLAPSKYIFNENVETNDKLRATTYPASYLSISGLGMKSEDQGNPYIADTSWAFGVNDALEIYLKKNDMSDNCEFSEQHLRYAVSKSDLDEPYKIYGTNGGGKDVSTFDAASAYWTRSVLNGPVSEASMIYDINKVASAETLLNCEKEDYYVTDTIDLSSCGSSESEISTRIDLIKSLVMEYGAVYINYDHYDGAFNESIGAYNNNYGCAISSGTECYNGVVIVGWDDDYSANNFGDSKPPSNGAFIVTGNRVVDRDPDSATSIPVHLGRYYLSYNMTPYFIDYGVVSGVKNSSEVNEVYEYDTTEHKGVAYTSSTNWRNAYANKYTNPEKKKQVIKSITTYCEVPESTFKIYISTDGTMSGLKAIKIKGKDLYNGYTSKYMGYVTLELEEGVTINDDFIVAIEVTNNYGIYDTIPQDINYVETFEDMGRCFVASSVTSMISDNYIDCGSNNNIIKVHVDYSDREWKFDDSIFDDVKMSGVTEDTEIDGLRINTGMWFNNSKKSFKGTYLNHYALLYKTEDKNTNSFAFPVNGPSNIYLIGKSNDENVPRRLAIYSDATQETEYITLSKAKGYEYKYRGGAGNIYIYSVDEKVRLYGIAVNDYDSNEYEPIDEGMKLQWDFSDVLSYGSTISENVEINDMKIFATSEKPVTVMSNGSTSNEGYRPKYRFDLEGSGNDDYRTIAVPIMPESDVYITARTSGTANGELYITNKYYCDIDSNLANESITITPDIKTYKFEYYGEGEYMYIRSKDNNISIFNIVEKPRQIKEYNEHNWVFDDMSDLEVGTVFTNSTIDELTLIGNDSRTAKVVNSTSSEFSKAIELTSDHFDFASKLEFNVCDSRGTSEIDPVRTIRVKAKSESNNLKLVLGDEYGYVVGAYPLSTTLQEYVFEYQGCAETLYLFTYYNDEHLNTEIYSISTSDVDYEADTQTISLNKNSNNQGRCILSVDNIPTTGAFKFILKYNEDEISFNSINLGTDKSEKFLSNENVNVLSNTPGRLVFSIKDISKQNWSGIIASVTFDFSEGVSNSAVTFSIERVYNLD